MLGNYKEGITAISSRCAVTPTADGSNAFFVVSEHEKEKLAAEGRVLMEKELLWMSLRGNTELASDCADSYRTVNNPSINTFTPVVPAATADGSNAFFVVSEHEKEKLAAEGRVLMEKELPFSCSETTKKALLPSAVAAR
jgi:hypothetical protein